MQVEVGRTIVSTVHSTQLWVDSTMACADWPATLWRLRVKGNYLLRAAGRPRRAKLARVRGWIRAVLREDRDDR